MPNSTPSAPPRGHWPYPLWIAHRGAGKLAPENTLAAFRVGASHGYRAFECDIKLSADGVPYALHDDTLARTTSGRGAASKLSWHELALLDAGGWHSRQWAGEPVPSLAAIVATVQRNGYALNVELKPNPGDERRTGEEVATACLAAWDEVDLAACPLPLLSSFKPEALRGAQDTAPELPRALLLDTLWEGWASTAHSLGCCAIVTHHGLMDAALVAKAHAAGWRTLCYTVNEAEEAQRLITLGIDGIITDAVDRLSPHTRAVRA